MHNLLMPLLCESQITFVIRNELHWLPVVQRIQLKRFKSLLDREQAYFANMCVKRYCDSERCQLRSAVRDELLVPLVRKSTVACRTFTYTDQSLWNALPHDIRDPPLALHLIGLEIDLKL